MSEENGYTKWSASAAGVACKSAHVTTVSAPTDFLGVHLDQHTSDRQRQLCFAVAAELSGSSSLSTVIAVVSYCYVFTAVLI